MDIRCRVYWGSHGCKLERGHQGSTDNTGHECDCCTCVGPHKHTIVDDVVCVGKAPYYGPETKFYGEDVVEDKARS